MGNRLTFWSKGPAIGLGNGADAMSKQTKIERLRGYWMKAQTEVNARRAENERLREAVERALSVEESVTMGQEKELRVGYREMLRAALVAAAERERFVAYPSGVVTGPCVCGSWPGGECLRCDVTDKAAAIIRAENERLREKLAKAWKTVG